MPINASHEFVNAEKKYLAAQTLEEKIECLEEMIRVSPSHKGAENLRAELKTRLRKFREKLEKGKKVGKGKKGIRKEGYQVVLIGKTNSGKSMLLSRLTNASPLISDVEFSTFQPELGIMDYAGVRAQVVDLPAVEGKGFDFGIANNADCVLLVVKNLDEASEIKGKLTKLVGKVVIVINKVDLLSDNENRKMRERCKSKKIDFVMISSKTGEGIEDLKDRIFEKMEVIRVYMKEPGKAPGKIPAVLPSGSTVRDVAESVYKGFSSKIKETRLTGPSGKFSNQKVGLNHKLKDKDIVEFHST